MVMDRCSECFCPIAIEDVEKHEAWHAELRIYMDWVDRQRELNMRGNGW